MQGIVLINGYPSGEKFIRQGERIAEALCALGVDTQVFRNGEIYAVMTAEGEVRCNLPSDCQFVVYLDKDKYLGRALEKCGVRLFNGAESVELCDDKLRTYQALQGSGLRMAKSIPVPLCYTKGARVNENFLQKVGEELGFPLVAKKSYGSFGEGVQLVHGYAELCALEQEWLYLPHFYQRYVSEACGRDIRVIVIGGKAVAAMERVAQEGEFRSNVELGGVGRKVEPSEAYRRAAEDASKALRLDYCGVDLLESAEGAVVCEVNSNAFFEGLEKATGVDVARLYAEYIRNAVFPSKKKK